MKKIITLSIIIFIYSCSHVSENADVKESKTKITDENQIDSLWNYRTVKKGYLDSLLFDICSIEDIEFTDLYLEMQSINYDKNKSLILVDSLKENGFKVKNWGRGNWMKGPRIVSFIMTNGQCECQVDKLYYYTESENNFEVTERIKCYEDNK